LGFLSDLPVLFLKMIVHYAKNQGFSGFGFQVSAEALIIGQSS